MGLDSVELVMEVEKYFTIRIPDQEAEGIFTIQDMANVVARHLSIDSDGFELRNSVINKIQDALTLLNHVDRKLKLSDSIFTIITPHEKEKWKLFENHLGLSIPKPHINVKESRPTGFWNKIKQKVSWNPLYEWNQITLAQFADAIYSSNHETLIDAATITTKYEIYIAIMSITVDKIGVDEYEVTPEKSFTNDLGVD